MLLPTCCQFLALEANETAPFSETVSLKILSTVAVFGMEMYVTQSFRQKIDYLFKKLFSNIHLLEKGVFYKKPRMIHLVYFHHFLLETMLQQDHLCSLHLTIEAILYTTTNT